MLDLLSFFGLTDKCLDAQKGLYQILSSVRRGINLLKTQSAENVGQQKRKKRRRQYEYRICTTGKLILWASTECRNCLIAYFETPFLVLLTCCMLVGEVSVFVVNVTCYRVKQLWKGLVHAHTLLLLHCFIFSHLLL